MRREESRADPRNMGAMPPIEAQRTLVKSPPELWAELSDPASLARHLGDFGEIRIARVEAETSVAWEAESASGTVELKPSGWGTKVTLTVVRDPPEPVAAEPEPEPKSESEPEPKPAPATPDPRPQLFARIFRRWRKERPPPVEPADPALEAEEPQPLDLAAELAAELAQVEATMAAQDAELLSAVLDRLGAAHHRPFSRG
jgi:hypothetical protein